jgi:hypothetical protein
VVAWCGAGGRLSYHFNPCYPFADLPAHCLPACLQLAEEQERDKEAAQIAAERYRREREMQRKEAEEARQRKKQAFLK